MTMKRGHKTGRLKEGPLCIDKKCIQAISPIVDLLVVLTMAHGRDYLSFRGNPDHHLVCYEGLSVHMVYLVFKPQYDCPVSLLVLDVFKCELYRG